MTHPITASHVSGGVEVEISAEAVARIATEHMRSHVAGATSRPVRIVLTDPDDMAALADSAQDAWDSWLAAEGDPDDCDPDLIHDTRTEASHD